MRVTSLLTVVLLIGGGISYWKVLRCESRAHGEAAVETALRLASPEASDDSIRLYKGLRQSSDRPVVGPVGLPVADAQPSQRALQTLGDCRKAVEGRLEGRVLDQGGIVVVVGPAPSGAFPKTESLCARHVRFLDALSAPQVGLLSQGYVIDAATLSEQQRDLLAPEIEETSTWTRSHAGAVFVGLSTWATIRLCVFDGVRPLSPFREGLLTVRGPGPSAFEGVAGQPGVWRAAGGGDTQ